MGINLYKATQRLHDFRLNNDEISEVYRALFGARRLRSITAEAFTPKSKQAEMARRLARDGRVAELWRNIKQELQQKIENTQAQIPRAGPPRCAPHLIPYYEALLPVLKKTRSLLQAAEARALTHRDGPRTPAQFASALRDRHGGEIFTRVIDSVSPEHAQIMGGAHWVDWVEHDDRLHIEVVIRDVMNNAPSRMSHPPRPFHVPTTALIQKRLDESTNALLTGVEQYTLQLSSLPKHDSGKGFPEFEDPHQALRVIAWRVAYERALKNLADWPKQRLPVKLLDLAFTSSKAMQWALAEVPSEQLWDASEQRLEELARKALDASSTQVQQAKHRRARTAAKAKPRSVLAKKPGRKPAGTLNNNHELFAQRLSQELTK